MVIRWRNRARRAMQTRLRDGLRVNGDNRPHYIVVGQELIAYHLVNLLGPATVRITVIVPLGRRSTGPDLASIRGVRAIKADRIDEEILRTAGLPGAAGLALMQQDDVGNIHIALTAQEIAPDVRVVMRMFNTGLGYGVKRLLGDCEVISDAAMAAPTFVAAALGELAPTHFHHLGRTLFVARRSDVRAEHIVCGLADTRDPGDVRMLPADLDDADVVLAQATGEPAADVMAARRITRSRRLRRPFASVRKAVRSFVTRKIGIATLVVVAVGALFGYLLSRAEHETSLDPWEATYYTLITAISGANVELEKSGGVQLMQLVLAIAGLALIPLITAAVVEGMVNARLALSAGRLVKQRADHVVVVGLGNVGTRVIRQLRALGIEVVAIDNNPDARGAVIAQQLDVPMIVGDAAREETLQEASVATCQALVVVTTDDVTNLQAALHGRAAHPDLRVVMRLLDGDLARRIRTTFGIESSHSVSYLAAPAFAAALRRRRVFATIPIERHALLVTEVVVAPGSPLEGRPLSAADQPNGVRVIALLKVGGLPWWSPPRDTVLGAGDTLTVVVRRAGLGWLLRRSSPPPQPPTIPAQPTR